MGKGRSKFKQAPPKPLSEAKFQSQLEKKRKAVAEEADSRGKKRKPEDGEDSTIEKSNGKKDKKPKPEPKVKTGKLARAEADRKEGIKSHDKVEKMQTQAKKSQPKKEVKKAKKEEVKKAKKQLFEDSDEDEDMVDDEFDLEGSEDESESDSEDGAPKTKGSKPTLKDDFMEEMDDEEGSDEIEDGSVYDSDEEARPIFSDDDDSDAEELLTAANIVGLTRKLDEERAAEAAELEAELKEQEAMQTNIDEDKVRVLGGVDEDEDVDMGAPDIAMLRTRITDTIRVLEDFSKLGEPGRSRAEYTQQMIKDIVDYYGYSEFLAEKLFHLFTPSEAFAFFEANEKERPLVIRTNTLRTTRRELAQALINRGVTLEPVGKWSKVGLQIFESQVPLGATPEYLAGKYILQAASSFLPVMALAPQENERVLDMASAPGGKTTYISALMKNTGCVFANDANKARTKGLIGNIHRLGVKNTIVCNYDAREFPRVIGGFDRVLLDAPCSGTGVISKDASVKTNKTEKDFVMLPHLQKQLLLAAIDSVDHASKTGGYIVYSTCSVTVDENEDVVEYALRKRPNVKLVDTGLTFGREGFLKYRGKHFNAKMNLTRRYYPHAFNVDGFFVAKFKKVGPTPVQKKEESTETAKAEGDEANINSDGEEVEVEYGGFDEDEDEKYLESAKRNALKKKGKNPHAKPTKTDKKTDKKEEDVKEVEKVTEEQVEEKKKPEAKKADGKKKKEEKKEDPTPKEAEKPTEKAAPSPAKKQEKKTKKTKSKA
jgi:25S rRNA (cytosine2870-C5)-methyltransferase